MRESGLGCLTGTVGLQGKRGRPVEPFLGSDSDVGGERLVLPLLEIH